MPEKATGTISLAKLRKWWQELDKKLLTKATPVEKEMDVLLDHDYDGIKELDNALPPWWKYGFYVTIVIGIIYMTHFHVFGTGKNPTEEYQTEMEFARMAKEEYDAQNKDKIDENNVPMTDAVGIGVGNELFHQPGMCASCHGQMGEGGAGPNLTDDYWIHKGSLNDIYMSIKKGYPDKGMQSWESAFTQKQISQLASYIKSIRGTNPPNAQVPKGDLYVEALKDTMNAVDTAKK
jgi:cytochrome c oxidase cbb3-type subunit 3